MGLFAISKYKIDRWDARKKGDKIIKALKKDSLEEYAKNILLENETTYLSAIAKGFFSRNELIYERCFEILTEVEIIDINKIIYELLAVYLHKSLNTSTEHISTDESLERMKRLFKIKRVLPDNTFFKIMEEQLKEFDIFELSTCSIFNGFFVPFLDLYLRQLKLDFIENIFRYIDYYFSFQLKATYFLSVKQQQDKDFYGARETINLISEEMKRRNKYVDKAKEYHGDFYHSEWNSDEFFVKIIKEKGFNKIKTTCYINPDRGRVSELVDYYRLQKEDTKSEVN